MWNWHYTNVDSGFFETWSPELAYVIGFFIADGSISNYNTCGRYSVKFQCNDKDVIEKISKVSGYKNDIMCIKRANYKVGYRISMAGKHVWQFFTDLGFDNNKTYNAVVPESLPNELFSHLIRGIFDGDGSVCLRNRTSNYPQVNVVGTKDVVDFVASSLSFYNNICKLRSIWRINFNGDNAVLFMKKVYKDSSIHMDRKFDIYKRCMCNVYKNNIVRWSIEDTELLKKLYPTTYSKDLVDVFNRSQSAIVSKARKLGIIRPYSNGKVLCE